ncbi:MAG: universal stress protein [Candidatus Binataceae bacterium]
MAAIKRILVPTDFSDPARNALGYAIEFAREHNAEILLLHVVEPIQNTRLMPDVSEILEHHRVEATEQLAKLERDARRRHPKCRSEVHFGTAYEVIAEIAIKWKADLIIIATHGRTGLSHLFLGSVAERVVRIAPCPVLTVRAGRPSSPKKRRASKRG